MQTATNPQTGEKLVLQNGQWVPLGQAPAAGPQPITVGTPRPKKPEVREVGGSLGLVDEGGGFTPTYTPPPKPEKDEKATDGEKMSAGYYGRAMRAHQGYGKGVPARDPISQVGINIIPGFLQPVVDANTGDERRAAENYADEFIRAKLRKESGASIAPEEMAKEYRTYFPIPGDGPDDIERKRLLREQAIEGLRVSSGASADSVGIVPTESSGARLTPEQDAQWQALLRSSPTPDQINAWMRSNGFGGVENAQAVADAARKGTPITDPDYSQVDAAAPEGGFLDALGEGAVDAITFGFRDELGAAGEAFAGAMRGDGSIGDLYNQNVNQIRGYQNNLQQDHGGAYFGGQLIGGLAVPVGAGANTVGRLAATGAAQGAAYGLGSGQGGLERLPGAVMGAGVGGAVGAGFGLAAPHIGNALAKFAPQRQQEIAAGLPIIEAGQRQGIPIRQPDVRPGLRGDLAAVETSPSAGPQVAKALESDRDVMAQRLAEQGGGGMARDPYALGDQVQGAVNRHGQVTKDQATILYGRARKAAPQHKIEPKSTIEAIDQRIFNLTQDGETANAAEVKVLEGIKADLQKSSLSIDSLQTQRKAMRQRLKDNNIDVGSSDASYMEIMKVAGNELEKSLSANPAALGALRNANKHYAERASFRKEVARQFIGTKNNPVAPETAANRLLSMTKSKGDFNRFTRLFNEMDDVEKTDLRATLAEGLGKGRNGEFSYGRFVTDIEQMNPRAIRQVFGKEGADALSDLKIIATAKRDTAAGLNHSNTGDVVSRNNAFKDMVLTAFGGGVAGIPGAMAGAVSRGALEKFTNKRAARMLLNPDFTKWVRQTPNSTSPAVINRHFARLSNIAAKDTVFAADVKALQQFLADSFSESTTRAAASENENRAR